MATTGKHPNPLSPPAQDSPATPRSYPTPRRLRLPSPAEIRNWTPQPLGYFEVGSQLKTPVAEAINVGLLLSMSSCRSLISALG